MGPAVDLGWFPDHRSLRHVHIQVGNQTNKKDVRFLRCRKEWPFHQIPFENLHGCAIQIPIGWIFRILYVRNCQTLWCNHIHTDLIDTPGRYYYAIQAAQPVGASDLSNNVYIDVLPDGIIPASGNVTITYNENFTETVSGLSPISPIPVIVAITVVTVMAKFIRRMKRFTMVENKNFVPTESRSVS